MPDINITHHYTIHYPDHAPRESDPHYADFNAYHRRTRKEARCYIGQRIGYDDCRTADGSPADIDIESGQQAGLELHHAHIEFAVQQRISLTALEVDYPGVSDPDSVGAWVESGANFRWLCVFHHRAHGGAHTASHSDWEGECYVLGLIS